MRMPTSRTRRCERFHAMFRQEALVIDKWFALQARAPERDGARVRAREGAAAAPRLLAEEPEPRAQPDLHAELRQPGAFHRADAAGYRFWAERVLELDAINPQLAARLARAMDRWSHLAEPYRSAAREAISSVAARADLSDDVQEIVTRALA